MATTTRWSVAGRSFDNDTDAIRWGQAMADASNRTLPLMRHVVGKPATLVRELYPQAEPALQFALDPL